MKRREREERLRVAIEALVKETESMNDLIEQTRGLPSDPGYGEPLPEVVEVKAALMDWLGR